MRNERPLTWSVSPGPRCSDVAAWRRSRFFQISPGHVTHRSLRAGQPSGSYLQFTWFRPSTETCLPAAHQPLERILPVPSDTVTAVTGFSMLDATSIRYAWEATENP